MLLSGVTEVASAAGNDNTKLKVAGTHATEPASDHFAGGGTGVRRIQLSFGVQAPESAQACLRHRATIVTTHCRMKHC